MRKSDMAGVLRGEKGRCWLGLLVLVLVLTGCTSQTSGGPTTQITPLSLTPRPTVNTTFVAKNTDWTTYHRDNARRGAVPDAADPKKLVQAWKTDLDGAVYAEPLVVGEHVLVATEGDSLYALDKRTGQIQWRTNVGKPVPLSTLPCGNIDPLGITGTPVYDPATGLVFAVAEVSGPVHVLVGVDVETGQVKVRRQVDVEGMETRAYQQRAALALFQNMVYIAYGGLHGDCGNYHGLVVASQTDGRGPLLSYQVPTQREGGIWAASGPAVDETGRLFVSVGNGDETQGAWDHSDSVLRLSPQLKLEDGFAPKNWRQENAADADLGSMGPILLSDGLIFMAGKSGLTYLLRANSLGGVGGQALEKQICRAYGGSALLGSTLFVPCIDGVRQIKVGPGETLTPGWEAPQANGSPIVGGHTVYTINRSGKLYALDSETGKERASLPIDACSRFVTPTLSGNYLLVGTLKGVVAATLS